VTLDSTLSFDKHVVDVTRSCHYHIRALRYIRLLLTLDTAKAMAVAIVGSTLDYTTTVCCMKCRKRIGWTGYSVCRTSWRELYTQGHDGLLVLWTFVAIYICCLWAIGVPLNFA